DELSQFNGELFFVVFCRRAQPACKKPLFFSPLPTAQGPLGEGRGKGKSLQVTKVHPLPSSYLASG
ncbi:MAG TPA: hypothetical protein PLG06_03770, partial [Anaerolineae bacterium]|nr:hypothetical protein [Anaerolineae bacterium]